MQSTSFNHQLVHSAHFDALAGRVAELELTCGALDIQLRSLGVTLVKLTKLLQQQRSSPGS